MAWADLCSNWSVASSPYISSASVAKRDRLSLFANRSFRSPAANAFEYALAPLALEGGLFQLSPSGIAEQGNALDLVHAHDALHGILEIWQV